MFRPRSTRVCAGIFWAFNFLFKAPAARAPCCAIFQSADTVQAVLRTQREVSAARELQDFLQEAPN